MFRRRRTALVIAGILAGAAFVRPAAATTIALGWNTALTGNLMLCDSVSASCTTWGQPFDPIVGGVAIADFDHDGQVEMIALGASGPFPPSRLHVVTAHPGSLVADIPIGNTPTGAILAGDILGFGVFDDGTSHFAIATTQATAVFSVDVFGADGTWQRKVPMSNVDEAGLPLTPLAFSVTHRDPADNGFVPVTGPNHAFAVLGYTGLFPGTTKVVLYGDDGAVLRGVGIDRDFRNLAGFAAGDLLSPTAGWFQINTQSDPGDSEPNPILQTYSDPSAGTATLQATVTLGEHAFFVGAARFFIAAAPECGKSVPPSSETQLNDCDGVDNDCDGLIDEDFTPRRVGTFDPIRNQTVGGAAVECERCMESTQCVGGRVIVPACANECVPAQKASDAGGWTFLVAAGDFDVGGGRFCFIPALPGTGPVNGVTCTTQIAEAGGFNPDILNAPARMSSVSVDPSGRAWSSDGVSLFVQVGSDLLKQAVPPSPCGVGAITDLELVGPPDKPLGGFQTSRPFIVCNHEVFELTLPAGPWIDHGIQTAPTGLDLNLDHRPDTMGASPSNNWDLFYKTTTAPPFMSGFLELSGSTIMPHGPLGLGARTATVGGVFVVGNDYAPGLIFLDGSPCVIGTGQNCVESIVPGASDPGRIDQWNGVRLAPVSDLLLPLAVPNAGDGKYERLSAPITEIFPAPPCVTNADCGDNNTVLCEPTGHCQDFDTSVPLKVVEGGPTGVAGPTLPGMTDVVWVRNNTQRIYVYLLPTISPAITAGLTTDDAPPIDATYVADRGNNLPPTAVCKNVTLSAGPSCTANIDASTVDGGTSDPDGDPFQLSVSPVGSVGLGTTSIMLSAFDDFGGTTCISQVSVVDATAPVLSAPPAVTAATCDVTALVTLGQPTTSDNCTTPAVTARVIASNGKSLASPILVTGNQVKLGLGTHTVEWSASDGTNTTKAQQAVVVLSAIQASQSFLVDDRAQLQSAAGGFAAVLNSGSGATRLGNDAHTGAIQSSGAVSLLDRARVEGNVVTASTYTPGNASVVTGSVTQHASVSFPATPTLPTFPTPSGSSRTVNSGSTYAPSPGSYPSLTVNSAATLVLAAGDYYFTTLLINGSATVRASATTRVFVRSQLTVGSSVRTATGALAPIVLGFAGTTFSLGVPFTGTLIAPSAALSIGSGSNLSFTGSFFAKTIELQPAVVLTCSAPAAPVMQALLATVSPTLALSERAPADGSGNGPPPPAARPAGAAGCACTVSGTPEIPWGAATIMAGLLLLCRSRRRPHSNEVGG